MAYDLLTENGYNMYEMSSMLQKAIRRADIPRAAYAANELSVKFRKYMWRRLMEISAEDCFGIITKEIVALWVCDEEVNKNRPPRETNDIFYAKAVILLCMARKNRDADYVAVNFMWWDRLLTQEELDEFVDHEEVLRLKQVTEFEIPEYVYDAHTLKGKKQGKNAIDFWKSEHEELRPRQISLFDFGNWGGWHKHYEEHGGISEKTERDYVEYTKGKELDPTHNGKDLVVKEPNWEI